MCSNGRHVYGGGQFYCWRKQENSKKTTDLSQVVLNLSTIRWRLRRALGIDSHYISIIEFLKLLLSVFIISFILVVVCDLCELKRIWLFISFCLWRSNYQEWMNFGVYRHFQQYFSYIMATSFIGGRSRSTRRKRRHGQATGKMYHLRLHVECTLFCNLQSWVQTHAVLVIGLYELLDPTT